ncbi:hypothetical protein [Dictyobacter kobayashii]|uniref:hypothetical protein n=1 Tax=Dictyobacter kobayashii TaxID=2014872 RepID=UPI001387322D|nr:hypothetical protein [Dictyobacter kobayashii]
MRGLPQYRLDKKNLSSNMGLEPAPPFPFLYEKVTRKTMLIGSGLSPIAPPVVGPGLLAARSLVTATSTHAVPKRMVRVWAPREGRANTTGCLSARIPGRPTGAAIGR